MIVIFIDDWSKEDLKLKREGKISAILEDKNYIDLDSIDNPYIIIYQTSGYLEIVSSSIKKRLLTSSSVNHDMPWFVSSKDLRNCLV